jgi:REP element-mobilizing transposase RayT
VYKIVLPQVYIGNTIVNRSGIDCRFFRTGADLNSEYWRSESLRQQLDFKQLRKGVEHGGSLGKGKRKAARPFSAKRAIHVVLRSSKARGKWSLASEENVLRVRKTTENLAKRWNIRIHEYGNAGNHLHLLVRAKSRSEFSNFLRLLAGQLAMLVTGARKGVRLSGGFWDQLAYTKLVSWGRQFERVQKYVFTNLLEGWGVHNRHWARSEEEFRWWWASASATISPTDW